MWPLYLIFLMVFAFSLIWFYSRKGSPSTESTPKTESVQNDVSRFKTTSITWLPERNFTFHEYLQNIPQQNVDSSKTDEKNLVLLFAWLFAQERHLDKYRQLYLQRGFDVLTIKGSMTDALFPPIGSQQIAAAVVRFLARQGPSYRSYLFQALSMGGYQMGEVFVRLNEERYKEVEAETFRKIRGLIYDSVLDYIEAPRGLSKAITNNHVLQVITRSLMNAYMGLGYPLVTRHYLASSRAIQANRCRRPILAFCSKSDPITSFKHQLEFSKDWRKEGIVTLKCWTDSPHVGHLLKYPEEYTEAVDEFLRKTEF